MLIRRLDAKGAEGFRRLRLIGLQESPRAFGTRLAEERAFAPNAHIDRLASRDWAGAFGAFKDGELVGVVGFVRENYKQLSHKVNIWGMYVCQATEGRKWRNASYSGQSNL